jgi:hypothetical protein
MEDLGLSIISYQNKSRHCMMQCRLFCVYEKNYQQAERIKNAGEQRVLGEYIVRAGNFQNFPNKYTDEIIDLQYNSKHPAIGAIHSNNKFYNLF